MAKTYSEGWDAYAGGRPIDDCTTDDARRGWWAANAGSALCGAMDAMAEAGASACDLDGFLDSVESSIEDDHAWIRTGC